MKLYLHSFNRPDARRSVVDVRCRTDDGSELIIEMQVRSQDDFTDRMVFYSSFPIINRLQRTIQAML